MEFFGDKEIDELIIIRHGSPGTLDYNGETLEDKGKYTYDSLNQICVSSLIRIYTCNSAIPNGDGVSHLYRLMEKSDAALGEGLYYAKTRWLADGFLLPRAAKTRREKDGISWIEPYIVTMEK